MPQPFHPFDLAMEFQANEHGFKFNTSKEYWNQSAPFGGVLAAQMLKSALISSQRGVGPLALSINFAAPPNEGEYYIHPFLEKGTATTEHWSLKLSQNQQLKIYGSVVLAKRRQSLNHEEVKMPKNIPSPESLEERVREMPMPWFRQFEIKPIRNLTSDNDSQLNIHSWIREKPIRPLDFLSLTAICDTMIPWIFRRRKVFVPIHSISQNIFYHASHSDLTKVGTDYVYTKSYGHKCSEGFVDNCGEIWTRENQLLVTARQMMWIKE